MRGVVLIAAAALMEALPSRLMLLPEVHKGLKKTRARTA
jgi:hypothetical protein